jgi:hypothetical protein
MLPLTIAPRDSVRASGLVRRIREAREKRSVKKTSDKSQKQTEGILEVWSDQRSGSGVTDPGLEAISRELLISHAVTWCRRTGIARTSSSFSTCHLAVSEDSQNYAVSGIVTGAILPEGNASLAYGWTLGSIGRCLAWCFYLVALTSKWKHIDDGSGGVLHMRFLLT